MKTRYTSYPSADPSTGGVGNDVITEEGKDREEGEEGEGREGRRKEEEGQGKEEGEGRGKGEGQEERDGGEVEGISETTTFNFYGSTAGKGDECKLESGTDIGTNNIVDDQPGAVVELPSYAPEVCVETIVRSEEAEKFSEHKVKEPPTLEVEPVTIEIMEEHIAMETEPHPPTVDDVTEVDIFGVSDEDTATEGAVITAVITDHL